MLSYANLLDRVEQLLQDTGNAIYSTAELGYIVEDCLKRMSEYDPVRLDVIFQIESRTGNETVGTASTLTDTDESQFTSTDDDNEKVIHNTTDDTWAVVLGYTSTSVLTISKDIMDDGDEYEIYNKRCKNNKQIYIGDMPPYLWVDSVEYPIGKERTFTQISRDIIELNVYDSTIEDSDSTLDPLNQVDVLVKFAMPQVLSQLTDWSGELTANALVGATTIAIDGMGSTEIIEVGEMFNLENHRTTYVITTEVTTSGNAATLVFYPPLEAASSDNDDITFVKSTLKPQHERILRDLVAGEAAISKSSQPIQEIVNAIAVLASASVAIGNMSARIDKAILDISTGKTETDKAVTLISTTANTEFQLINPQIDLAVADLAAGRALINTVAKGGAGVPTDYANYASGEVNAGRGYLTSGEAYIRQAQADEQLASNYLALASHEFSAAVQYFNQGASYLRKINTAISLAGASRYSEDWGRRRIDSAERELRQMATPRMSKILPKG